MGTLTAVVEYGSHMAAIGHTRRVFFLPLVLGSGVSPVLESPSAGQGVPEPTHLPEGPGSFFLPSAPGAWLQGPSIPWVI
jgi:hypothetical protein